MTKLFFSYSHRDEDLRNELEKHMAMMRRDGTISSWHDRRITAGSEVDAAISEELESADIILLLVSAAFLNSAYCYDREMARALERHKERTTTVIPVILSPCDWLSSPLKELMATPPDGKAVTKFANMDDAFVLIVQAIRAAAAKYQPAQAPVAALSHRLAVPVAANSTTPSSLLCQAADPKVRSSNLRMRKKFTDHDREVFREDVFECMARYFANSLDELQERNPQIEIQFKRIDANRFTAKVFENGTKVAECAVSNTGSGGFGRDSITYSNDANAGSNTANHILTVGDDGYTQHLSSMFGGGKPDNFRQEGAAEFLWSMLIERLQ